ncbi:MAG: formate dehydrogenase accessory protein FdhE [Gammaproteobacteria bacterium]|nr:formate dehydrogenase accessory protein FdhE [Gammaproteobacteria bacterium]
MPRILEKGQIEALESRAIPPIILPDPTRVFAARAARLAGLATDDPLGGYLGFAAALARAQEEVVGSPHRPAVDPAAIATALEHRMPPLPARGLTRGREWREILRRVAASLSDAQGFPDAVHVMAQRIGAAGDAELEAIAERLLSAEGRDRDPAAAPVVIAALQVYWVALAAGLDVGRLAMPEEAAVCPVCGMPPVASVVKATAPLDGYRYLHCGLCATEWHRVRVQCTQCGGSRGVALHSIEGRSPAIRAETCDGCRSYRKIFYLEHDAEVDPLADDLASIALDLLLAEADFHRASPNPWLWQPGP